MTNGEVTNQDGDVYADVLLRVIVFMMVVDGEIADEEVKAVTAFYYEKTGVTLEAEAIQAVIDAIHEDTENTFVQTTGAALSPEQKADILRGSLSVAMADEKLADNEGAYLMMVAKQLGVSEPEFHAILEEGGLSVRSADDRAASSARSSGGSGLGVWPFIIGGLIVFNILSYLFDWPFWIY